MLIRTIFHSNLTHKGSRVLHSSERFISMARAKRILSSFLSFGSSSPPYSHICQIGDPVLRTPAMKIEVEAIQTPAFQEIVADIVSVMRKYHLCGIAAPQVGIPWQIFTVEQTARELDNIPHEIQQSHGMKPLPLTIAINPVLTVTNYDIVIKDEACASIHGFSACVPRYTEVMLEALDLKGQPFKLVVDGHLARIFQHEYDHLHGTLYTDKMDTKTLSLVFWQDVNRRQGKIMWSYRPTLKSRILTSFS